MKMLHWPPHVSLIFSSSCIPSDTNFETAGCPKARFSFNWISSSQGVKHSLAQVASLLCFPWLPAVGAITNTLPSWPSSKEKVSKTQWTNTLQMPCRPLWSGSSSKCFDVPHLGKIDSHDPCPQRREPTVDGARTRHNAIWASLQSVQGDHLTGDVFSDQTLFNPQRDMISDFYDISRYFYDISELSTPPLSFSFTLNWTPHLGEAHARVYSFLLSSFACLGELFFQLPWT